MLTHRGFTLVELLVVVSIIIILLALMMPAMDKAIYQAELATCAARMNATVKGVSTYAMDFKRRYPHRPTVAGGGNTYPWQLNVGPQGALPEGSDDRIALRGYVDLKLLVDPLGKQVRLDTPDSWVYSSYALWFGWSYTGQEGMTKAGNRLNWVDTRETPGKAYSVSWLITDLDAITPSWPMAQGSHPDHDSLLHNLAIEAGAQDGTNPVIVANNQVSKATISYWTSVDVGFKRGGIEMNAASSDGSITRYNDVSYDQDPRMGSASSTPAGQPTAGDWLNIPVR